MDAKEVEKLVSLGTVLLKFKFWNRFKRCRDIDIEPVLRTKGQWDNTNRSLYVHYTGLLLWRFYQACVWQRRAAIYLDNRNPHWKVFVRKEKQEKKISGCNKWVMFALWLWSSISSWEFGIFMPFPHSCLLETYFSSKQTRKKMTVGFSMNYWSNCCIEICLPGTFRTMETKRWHWKNTWLCPR